MKPVNQSINQSMRLSSTMNDSDGDGDSQGVRTQRRNLQHGEDDMRLVFGVMISLCCKRWQDMSWKRNKEQIKRRPGEIFSVRLSQYGSNC